jgi:hypothetical protein
MRARVARRHSQSSERALPLPFGRERPTFAIALSRSGRREGFPATSIPGLANLPLRAEPHEVAESGESQTEGSKPFRSQ